MTNLMPLVHHVRRTVRYRHESNALSAAYLTAPKSRTSRAIKVELDLLETLI